MQNNTLTFANLLNVPEESGRQGHEEQERVQLTV